MATLSTNITVTIDAINATIASSFRDATATARIGSAAASVTDISEAVTNSHRKYSKRTAIATEAVVQYIL